MLLEPIDWLFIFAFFVISLVVGVAVSKRAGRSSSEFFLSGRNMPWWLLGFSMVATTFSTDTPNLVTNLVRQHGVSGNWKWIKHVHIKDALYTQTPGRWGVEVPWGAGQAGGGEFLKVLKQINFVGALAIEREAGDDRLGDIKTAVEALNGFAG